MPKDADFNSKENIGLTSVYAYSQTLSTSGAIDMWGNVWEWTSTNRNAQTKDVKGGSWSNSRMDSRTESRIEGRKPNSGYNKVGFRIIRESN